MYFFPVDFTISVYMMATFYSCTLRDFYIAALPFLMNWKEKWFNEPQTCSWKIQFSCCLQTAKYYLFDNHKVFEYQTRIELFNIPRTLEHLKFINYHFLYTRFCLFKTIIACPCLWEIMHVKEQTCKLLIITIWW